MQTTLGQIGPGAARPPASETAAVPRARVDAPSSAGLLLGAVGLGAALQINFGQYHPLALLWLTVALVLVAVSLGVPRAPLLRVLKRKTAWVVGAALGVQLILLLTRSPGATGGLAGEGTGLWPFRAGVVVAAAFVAASLLSSGRMSRVCLAGMMAAHAALGLWVLRAAPEPGVDVVMFQREASRALLNGENPYSATFHNPYADSDKFYGPGVVRDGQLLFGYPYPPLSLLLAVPGHVLGDFRYAQLVAMTTAGGLIALARPGRLATAAAAVLLFTPRGFFVLEAGWTEPFAVLLLAATVFVACRRPGAVAVPLGLLIAVKQYLFLGLLLLPLLPTGLRQTRRTLAWMAVAVAAAATLPMALWDLPAFVRSAVLLQFHQPFRNDSLSYLAGIFHATGWQGPSWVAFALIIPTMVFCLRRCPRTPAGYAAGLALVCVVFFAFGKQAFCNYYHFVIGTLCSAAGAAAPLSESTAEDAKTEPVSP